MQGEHRTQTPIQVRPAQWEDVQVCLSLDMHYTTTEVWQLHLDPGGGPGGITVRFHAVRLTRPAEFSYPRTVEELQALWQRNVSELLVALREGQVVGFVDVAVQPAQDVAWLYNLVVDRPHRRQGVGSVLLGAAAAWARERGLRRLVLEASTRNGPAIRFCFAHGAEFCGFRDRYYANHDIALFFEYRVG